MVWFDNEGGRPGACRPRPAGGSRGFTEMKILKFPLFAMTVLILASPAQALTSAMRGPTPDCTLEAQRTVARRHGLRETPADASRNNSLSLRIYADPKLAQEADDAFDACVRRQP